jgi:hypothetical protein
MRDCETPDSTYSDRWTLTWFTTNDFTPRADGVLYWPVVWKGRGSQPATSTVAVCPRSFIAWDFTISAPVRRMNVPPARKYPIAKLRREGVWEVLISAGITEVFGGISRSLSLISGQHIQTDHDDIFCSVLYTNQPTTLSYTICTTLPTPSLNKKQPCAQSFVSDYISWVIQPKVFDPRGMQPQICGTLYRRFRFSGI